MAKITLEKLAEMIARSFTEERKYNDERLDKRLTAEREHNDKRFDRLETDIKDLKDGQDRIERRQIAKTCSTGTLFA